MNASNALQLPERLTEKQFHDIQFNSNQSYFITVTNTSFQVYKSDPLELRSKYTFHQPLIPLHAFNVEQDFSLSRQSQKSWFPDPIAGGNGHGNGIAKARMLSNSNYLTLVTPHECIVWDDYRSRPIFLFDFGDVSVVNATLTKHYIIIALERQLLIYTMLPTPTLVVKYETFLNESGVMDIRLGDSAIIAFPARSKGQIQVVTLTEDGTLSTQLLKSHKSSLRTIAISPSGRYLASASELGTIIRVHDIKTSSLVNEFRRGADPAVITSMKFSPNDTKLAVVSDKATLHIFKVGDSGETKGNKHHKLHNFSFLPQYFQSTWSFVSKNLSHDNDLVTDTAVVGWSDSETIVVIWEVKAIWEKWHLQWISKDDTDSKGKWVLLKGGWKTLAKEGGVVGV